MRTAPKALNPHLTGAISTIRVIRRNLGTIPWFECLDLDRLGTSPAPAQHLCKSTGTSKLRFLQKA